jgi:hypothetical protein
MFTIEEALERVRTSPPLRKVKDFIDRTDLSADMKALLYDIAKFTIKGTSEERLRLRRGYRLKALWGETGAVSSDFRAVWAA